MRFTEIVRFGALFLILVVATRTPMIADSDAETIGTFAADCATSQAVFTLGDSVCALASGTPLGPPAQRRFEWVAPDGAILKLGPDIISDPQEDSITIPKAGSFAQVGTWTVKAVDFSNKGVSVARFVVHDPAGAACDLSVSMFGSFQSSAGSSATFTIHAINNGPNEAQDVRIAVAAAGDAVVNSAEQTAGPVFSRAAPGAGDGGAITFAIATLPANAAASFTVVYQISSDLPTGASISSTATISSSTHELYAADNVATATTSIMPQPCNLACPANLITAKPAGQCGVAVSYSLPGASGGNCGSLTCSPASGSFFPVGSSNVICFGKTGSPCSFTVIVDDSGSLSLTCPPDIAIREDSPGMGLAIVKYKPPTLNGDCAADSSACTPPSGASFPLGVTSVSCSVKNAEDQRADCSFTVTVEANDCSIESSANIIRSNKPGQCGAAVSYPSPSTKGSCGSVTCTPPSGGVFPIGVTAVSCTTAAGSSSSFAITIQDTQAPAITRISANPSSLAPLDRRMKNVTIDYGAEDNCPGEPTCVLSVESDEPRPPGEAVRDWEILDAHHVRLRADRSVIGERRIYTIRITCRDIDGNASSETVKVIAPGARR